MLQSIDAETACRCALSALRTLEGEFNALDLEAGTARRIGVLLTIAKEHVSEMVDDEAPLMSRRPPEAWQAADASRSLEQDIHDAWAASAAMHHAADVASGQAARRKLQEIGARSVHEKVRRFCAAAVSTRPES